MKQRHMNGTSWKELYELLYVYTSENCMALSCLANVPEQ